MRIKRDDTAAILVDIQERLVPVIHDGQTVVSNAARLVKGLQILDVPVLPARQYPKGLGGYVPEILEALGEHTPQDKRAFSVCGAQNGMEALEALGKKNVLVFGIEAHVCVLQTVTDLKAAGYQPVLVCDCIGSRKAYDCKIAIKRARQEGALLTTCEAVLFELLECAEGDDFKAVSKLVK